MLSDEELELTYETFVRCKCSIRATAAAMGMSRAAIRKRLERARTHLNLDFEQPIARGQITPTKTARRALPRSGKVNRYILTSAQNNTHVHEEFWDNLRAYAHAIDAEIMVSRFTYNKASYAQTVKPGTQKADDRGDLWYDDCIADFVVDHRIELGKQLVFCGETNILPTAKRPLSGYETYSGRDSAIFPHAKIALETVAGTRDDGPKFIYTTGTITQRNYLQRKAGLQAEHHHTYGAAIAEVNWRGEWWVRQINATDDGSFYDLDAWVHDGEVTVGHHVEAINWGDVHTDVLDDEIRKLYWGDQGVLDTLRPTHQFMHDTLDFRARNHHEINNPHQMFKRYVQGAESVADEIGRVRDFLDAESYRDFCMTVVVDSNHDNAMERWLRESDYRYDPTNAIFFLECQLEKYRAVERGDDQYQPMREALRRMGINPRILFLGPDDSFVICPDQGGGIECGMHGHLGPNGSRGSPRALSRMGRKANTGHTHTTQIIDGMYVAGTSSRLRLDYTKGPSSWSHSFIVTYSNGKRAVVTVFGGKWRA